MITSFPETAKYLGSINIDSADLIDQTSYDLIRDEDAYERASQALRRRFVRGAEYVEGVDRNERFTKIKREKQGGKYIYFIMGEDGKWSEPDERIWVVAMYALWQKKKKGLV